MNWSQVGVLCAVIAAAGIVIGETIRDAGKAIVDALEELRPPDRE